MHNKTMYCTNFAKAVSHGDMAADTSAAAAATTADNASSTGASPSAAGVVIRRCRGKAKASTSQGKSYYTCNVVPIF
jgi:hypothetical protein